MSQPKNGNPDALVFTFPAGSSLTRLERWGALEREIPFFRGIADAIPRIVFASTAGSDERRVARQLADRLGVEVSAVSESELDAELGGLRSIEERVLAELRGAKRVVIQTLQLDDGGLGPRLLAPLRRAGIRVGLVARGTFIESRVRANKNGPAHFSTLQAAEVESRICSTAQIVVGTSDAMIDELSWKNGIGTERTRVISQHVSINPLAIAREPGVVITAGRLSGGCESIRMVIDAVGMLAEPQREKACLEIIGDGPDGADLQDYAASLGVHAKVRRGLTHSEVVAALARSTMYVHAEDARRQSHVVLEALAIGCPVVISDLPEYNGLIVNGSSGLRVTPEPRAFSFAIDCLLNDRGFRELLGETASTQVAFRCAVERVIADTLSAYGDALRLAPQQGKDIDRLAS